MGFNNKVHRKMSEEIKFKSCKKKNLRLRKKSSDDDEDQNQAEEEVL